MPPTCWRAAPTAFAERLEALRGVEWVVYAKRPFAGPAQVLAYLGRYTHRVAIANSRLTGHDLDVCPDCGGRMQDRGPLPPRPPPPRAPFWCDSS